MISPLKKFEVGILLSGLVLAPSGNNEALSAPAEDILKTHCYGCHGENGSDDGGFGSVLNTDQLIRNGIIIRGKPEQSPLFEQIQSGDMPAVGEPLDQNQKDAIAKWIRELPAPSSDSPATLEQLGAIALQHLNQVPLQARPHTRYFYFGSADAHNRYALTFLLNSLSRDPVLTKPIEVQDQALYAIDIRNFGWDQSTWDDISDRYPYEAGLKRCPSCGFLQTLTRERLPILRADWFIATATRSPLYERILKPGNSFGQFVSRLRPRRETLRAGFSNSGVSQHNRIIERRATRSGYLWMSYDFDSSEGRNNIFNFPLTDRSAGGEAIYSLPNGLQAYLLYNAKGSLLSSAPTHIVSDPERDDRAVSNAISCYRCHGDSGILPKTDQIHGIWSNKTDRIKNRVLSIYPLNDVMEAQYAQDQERYQSALARLELGPTPYSDMIEIEKSYQSDLDAVAILNELELDGPDLLADSELAFVFYKTGAFSSREEFERLYPELTQYLIDQFSIKTPREVRAPKPPRKPTKKVRPEKPLKPGELRCIADEKGKVTCQ